MLYPWFSVSLLAVAIPCFIHLLQLRRPERILFSNTAFVRKVELVMMRHRKVKHFLILMSRILTVVALVLAFCQPLFLYKNYSNAINQSSCMNISIDNTFSMQLRGDADKSLFETAVAQARSLVNILPSGENFRLAGTSDKKLNTYAYQVALDEFKISASKKQYGSIYRNYDEHANKGGLYLFSDFQKSGFDANLLSRIGKDREVILVPIVGRQAANAYVDSVWLDDAFVRSHINVALHVRVRNGGNSKVENCPVKIFIGAQQAAAFQVTIDAGATVTAVAQVQVPDEKIALGKIVTEDSPASFDNTYYFSLQPAKAIRVLEIGPLPLMQQLCSNEPFFAYEYALPQHLNYSTLRLANLVILSEVKQIDAGLQQALDGVRKRGGSIVIIPSPQEAGRISYQQLFKQLGVGQVQWELPQAVPELRDVAMPNNQEPFFRNVFGVQQRNVTMPKVAPVLRWARTGTDVLRMQDGESYLADFVGLGSHVYVFSAPFSKEYSDFTTHALFVPVMYRMAILSYRNEQLPAYRMTEKMVLLELPHGVPIASGGNDELSSYMLVRDSLRLIPAQRTMGQEIRLELPDELTVPGFYQLKRGNEVLTTLAFNQDKKESELATYSADELRRMIGPNRPNIRVVEVGSAGMDLIKAQAEQMARPLWRYFLALALVGMLAETLLVRFGGRGGEAASVKEKG